MSDQHSFVTCPSCGAHVHPTDVFCRKCRLNLPAVERQVAQDRPTRERDAQRDEHLRTEQRDTRIAWSFAALVTAAIAGALILIFPLGPDLKASDLENSIKASLKRDGPPSSAGDNTTFKCVHPIIHTRTFTCRGTIDVALLPDVDVTFNVTVRSDRHRVCWSARDADEDSDLSAYGCIRR